MLTVLSALGFGLLVFKLKVPGGMLVGAIVGAAVLNLATGKAFIYAQARVVAQALTGAYIGCMMTRENIHCLPRIIRPYLFVLACLLATNLMTAAIFCWTTDLDLLTCLFCAAPGGISDTTLIAIDMGADGSVVAVMQLVRMLFGMGCLPSIIMLSDRIIEHQPVVALEAGTAHGQAQAEKRTAPTFQTFLPTFCIALAAAVCGKLSGLPAGALSAALIAAAAMKVSGHCTGMPMWLRRASQVVSGCCIGSMIDRGQVIAMKQLALPVVVLCLGYMICCIGMGSVVSRMFQMPLKEAMLTLSPAGATEMALIAADLGVESTNLVVLQICRLVGVMLFFPQIFSLVMIFLN